MKNTELKRIEDNNNAEFPEKTKIIISVRNVQNPENILNRTKEIMKAVSQFAYTDQWPSDEEWKSLLPQWFVESMTLKTMEEIMKVKGQWHFESWIANIKDRAWVWYSSKVEKNSLEFILETLSIPYLHSTFVYILYSQGIPMENISILDDME